MHILETLLLFLKYAENKYFRTKNIIKEIMEQSMGNVCLLAIL